MYSTRLHTLLSSRAIASLIVVTVSLIVVQTSSADLIDDVVFVHDFENISDNTIVAIQGPNATKTSNIDTNTTDPLAFSAQHIKAPVSSSYASVDTNTQLTGTTSALSFSIFYNDRGDNGSDVLNNVDLTRLLSSFRGRGATSDATLFDFISSSGRRLRFVADGESVLSTATVPFRDSKWHQAGVVFDEGEVTFYFDGVPFGNPVALPSVTMLSAQDFGWFLIEDAQGISSRDEFFDGGDYDEAALWYRALSSTEMDALFQQGVAATVPEPSGVVLALLATIGIATRLRRRRRTA